MVRTYAFNALTQSSDNIFNNNNNNNQRRGNFEQSKNFYEPPQRVDDGYRSPQRNNGYQSPPEDPMPPLNQNIQYTNTISPPLAPSLLLSSYNMPSFLHSPYVDPVGSIVGLRVVYSEGKINYVPVEPHINYLINQQFGAPVSTQPSISPSVGYQQPQQSMPPIQQYQQPQQQQLPPQPQQISQQIETQMRQRRQQQPYEPADSMRWLPNRVETPLSVQSLPSDREPRHNVRQSNPEMKDDYWFPNNPQPRSGVRRSREWRNDVDTDYNPWGRGGGGSPLKDSMGNLIADRRLLGRSWSTVLPTNISHNIDYQRRSAPNSSKSYNDYPSYPDRSTTRMPSFAPMAPSSSMPNLNKGPLSDADQHRMELAKQIEENKRRKELEKQKEKEEEEREMRRHEEYMAKIRREEEEEKRRQREKAILHERRSQQIREEQVERARQLRRRSPPPPQRQMEEHRPERPDSAAPRELEWWEKKPTWQQQQQQEESRRSAVIPTLRGKPPRTPSAQRSVSRHSHQRYDPSSSIQEHVEDQERDQVERERQDAIRSRRGSRRNSALVRQESLNESFRQMDVSDTQRPPTPVDFGSNVASDARGRPTAFVIQ